MPFFTPLIGLLVVHLLTSTARCDDWVQAAGPNGNFIVEGNAPLSFSVARNAAILWRVATPFLPPPLRSKGGFKALLPKANS